MPNYPKPAAVKIAQGNPGHERIGEEPKPRAKKPTCPSWLNDDARKVWRETCRELEAMDLLFSADRQTLIAYCLAAADLVEAENLIISNGGAYYSDQYGTIKRHPALITKEKAVNTIAKLAGILGLNVIARARLGCADAKKDAAKDELKKFLSAK